MKNIGIPTPCSENWNEMTPNEQGAFCQKCASQVYDFSKKSTLEIKQTLRSLIGQPVCGRFTQSQEDALNLEFESWMNSRRKPSFQQLMFFSFLVVFGLALFSCENEQDKKKIQNVQTAVMRVLDENKIEVPKDKTPTLEEVETEELKFKFMSDLDYRQEIVQLNRTCDDYIESPKQHVYTEIIEERILGGAVVNTHVYERYLLEEVKADENVELDANGEVIPKEFKALAFPNPADEQTTLEIGIPQKNRFEISLYDMNGRFIQTVFIGNLERGTFRQPVDLAGLNAGAYVFRIIATNFKESVTIIKN